MIQWPHVNRRWEDRGVQQAILDFEECLSAGLPAEGMPLLERSCSLWSTTLEGKRLAEAQARAKRGYEWAWERLLRVRASKDS